MQPARTVFGVDDEALARVQAQHAHLCSIGISQNRIRPVTAEQFRTLIEAAFWASLREDEGRPTRVRIAVVPVGMSASSSYSLQRPLPYSERSIAKLAPAVPPHGCIIATLTAEGISMIGIEANAAIDPVTGVLVESYGPGVVRVGLGAFQPYVVFSGPNTVFTEAPRHTTLAAHLQRILGRPFPTSDLLEAQAGWHECLALADLARELVNGGHGGTLLVVPEERGDWMSSLDPYPFQLARADTSVPDAIRSELRTTASHGDAIHRLYACSLSDDEKVAIMAGMTPTSWNRQDMTRIASLAAVDGAVVVGPDVRIFGFGAKIKIREQGPVNVCMFQPEPGKQEIVPIDLEELGGTRHQSAVRFVGAHHDTIAIIASQDRRLSVAGWNEEHRSVFVLRDVQWWT
jgi:hypothetical protein